MASGTILVPKAELVFDVIFDNSSIAADTTYNLESGKKFSDYFLLIFSSVGYQSWSHSTILSALFRATTWVHWQGTGLDSNNSYKMSYKYKSDTSFTTYQKGASIGRLIIYGIKINNT